MPLPRATTDAKKSVEKQGQEQGEDEENSICPLCNKGVFGEVEVLCTLDCRFCPSTTYHVECVDRYVKRGVWRNRRSQDVPGSKTGLYPCPRGPEVCRGTIHSSHTKLPDTEKKRKKKAAMAAVLAQAATAPPKPPPAPAPAKPPPAPKPALAPRVLVSAPQVVQPTKAAVSGSDAIERQRTAVAAIRSELNGGSAARGATAGASSADEAAAEAPVWTAAKILPQPVVHVIPGAEWVEGSGKASRRRRGGGDKKAAADPRPAAAATDAPVAEAAAADVPLQCGACVQSLEQYNRLLGITGSGVEDGMAGGKEAAGGSGMMGSPSVEGSDDNTSQDGAAAEQMYYTEGGELVTLSEYAKLYGVTARHLADLYSLPYSDSDGATADVVAAADSGAVVKATAAVEPEQVKEVTWGSAAAAAPGAQSAGASLHSTRGLLPWQIVTGAAIGLKAAPGDGEARPVVVAELGREDEIDVDDLLALCLG